MCSCFDVRWSFGVGACHTDTTPTSHTETPTHIKTRTHNQYGDTIENSKAPDCGCINVRKMLSIEEVKWNLIDCDIKLVSYSSTITMMHGPIYIRSSTEVCVCVCVRARRNSKQTLTMRWCWYFAHRTLDSATLCMPSNNTAQTVTHLTLLWKYRVWIPTTTLKALPVISTNIFLRTISH